MHDIYKKWEKICCWEWLNHETIYETYLLENALVDVYDLDLLLL